MRIAQDDIVTKRAELAVSLLKSGESPLQFENISITNYPGEEFIVNVWSRWQYSNLTQDLAVAELENGFIVFSGLLDSCSALKMLGINSGIPIYLCEDYGMGSIRICERICTGEVKWLLPPKT